MTRPKFPSPYTPLTPEIIRGINEAQAYYDENPERAEREQRQRAERDREEKEQLAREEEEHYRNNNK